MPAGDLRSGIDITPMRRIAPSRYLLFKECMLREVWSAAREPPLLPSSPAGRLGGVTHRLLEEAGQGRFDDQPAVAIDDRWRQLVEAAEGGMRAIWFESNLLPISASVNDFEVRRARALRIARDIVTARRDSAVLPPRLVSEKDRFEVWVESSTRLVGGFIDWVHVSDDGPEIRDIKTGHILDGQTGSQPGAIRDSIQVQLKMYASLYASSFGVWPKKLSVLPIEGSPRSVEFSQDTCTQLVAEAEKSLARLNARIMKSGGAARETEMGIATPAPGVCRYCVFRPCCAAYYTRRAAGDPTAGWPNDVWGTVHEIAMQGNGRAALTVERPTSPKEVRIRNLSLDRQPALASVRQGSEVAVFSLRSDGSDTAYTESRFTVVYAPQHGEYGVEPE